MADPGPSSSRLPFTWPHTSDFMNSMFPSSASTQPVAFTALASTGPIAPSLEFNEIQVTDPSSQADGVLSARIDTRIKLRVSFRPGSPIQFLKIPKTSSVHGGCPEPEWSLKFSLELKGVGNETIIRNVCSKCKERKDQATWNMVDFRATTTTVTIENGTASIEFFIKCYAHHHGIKHFCADAILRDYQDNVIDRMQLPLLFYISGKGKQLAKPKKAQRRAVRGVSAQQHSIIPVLPPFVNPSAQDPQHVDNGTVQEWITSRVGTLAGDNRQTGHNDQQPSWVDTTMPTLPTVDPFFWYTAPVPVLNSPPLMSSTSQHATQPSEIGFGSHDIGSLRRLDSLPHESNSNPVVYTDTRANASPHGEQVLPVMSCEDASVLCTLGPSLGEPHCGGSINAACRVPEATSQMLGQSASGTSQALNTSSTVPSGQGGSAPDIPRPAETSRLQIGSPSHTRNEGMNPILLEEVDPERGPTTGGIRVALFGENFPAVPLYVWFGNNWVRARRRDARTLRCCLPPSAHPGDVHVTLSQTPSRNAPQVGWSTATFKYEDSRKDAFLSILQAIYQVVDETTRQMRPAQSFASVNAHLNPRMSTSATHLNDQEREEIPQGVEEVNLEDISIHFLCTYSAQPNWKQIVSSCNDYGQTMAHICITLGYFRLLQHLFTWQIDLNVVDNMGLTALHYAYLFRQEECARFLIRSGANQFILDDLGRSPSNLNPSLEVRLHPNMEIGADSSTPSTSPADPTIEMPEEAERLYAKNFLVQQWRRKVEDERSEVRETPPPRHRMQDVWGNPDAASTTSTSDSADERVGQVMPRESVSSTIQISQGIPTLVASQDMETLSDTACNDDTLDERLFEQGIGLSDPVFSGVIKRRRILELLKRLRNLGGTLELDLPQIIVVGSQSVGKSSLIENISGITLPRDSGTCTRCPIECHTSSSSFPWRAVVSVRHIVDSDGKRLDQPTLRPFGLPIEDRADVEMRIRQAQQALLNPDMPMEMFLTSRGMSKPSALRFTRNSIVVEIKGQGLDDLAFVDLPAVIASVGPDGRESDIADVEELVSEFIKDPHCLILLAISCETDPENQRGRYLVRQFDELGERTIPVLTKPDRIDPGDEGKWLDMLRNRSEKFNHGWFCVRQPGFNQLQARITPEEARMNERDFFERNRPWSTAEPDLRARFGTKALSEALSHKLFEVIGRRLPEVQNDLHRSLKDVHAALDAVQYKDPADPLLEVQALLHQFLNRIHAAVSGTLGDKTQMRQIANNAYRQFVEDIGRMTPRFRPWPREREGAQDSFPEYPNKLRPREVDEEKLQSHIVYLDEIATRLRETVTSELPGNVPYQTKLGIIREYIDGWLEPSEDIVYYMCSNLRSQLSEIVHETFMKYIPGGLHALVWNIVEECLDQLKDTCLHRIREAFDREKSSTTTFQIRQFEAYKILYEEHYTAMYQRRVESDDSLLALGDAVAEFIERKIDELGPASQKTPLLVPNRPNILGVVQHKNYPPEGQCKAALTIMAEVRSYYDLAMQRYTDNVPMILDDSLMHALEKALSRALTAELPISGPDAEAECKALLQPSEETVAKLQVLVTRRALLEGARRELKTIWALSL